MAREGGIGILHRNLSIEDQAHQVTVVKRSESGMVTDPVTIGPEATLAELDALCGQYRVSGLPVVDERGRAARHRHQPRPALHPRQRVRQPPRARGHDADAPGHRARRHQLRGRRRAARQAQDREAAAGGPYASAPTTK
ncbi:IMP dehydrogenase [Georgenia sp. SUBG003]|uniref:IMP dehydrogenase n=1 Tax=Georgenia sp. SUBG003 TaxID=1497974 RepID=UPI003AB5E6CC